MATTFADQQKGEFIGSVSHELRSPLHGILASIELLQDTDCTTFQKSCLDSADACAQTLVDTGSFFACSRVQPISGTRADQDDDSVTMVLDYSRANGRKTKLPCFGHIFSHAN
jgi:signal transduction histidine kinase